MTRNQGTHDILQCLVLPGRTFSNRGEREHGESLEELDRGDTGHKGAGGGDKGRADDGGRMRGSGGGEDADGGGGDELDGAGVDGKEGAHRIGGGAGPCIQGLEILHGPQAEWGGGVPESKHVGRDIHYHGSHGGMVGGHLGKEAREQWAQEGGKALDGSRFLSQAHDAEPKGHDCSQGQGNREKGGFAGVKGRRGNRLCVSVEDSQNHSAEDETKP